MIVSKYGFEDILQENHVALDPSRVAAQVVSGVGFLGAGTIIIQKQIVKGLTTAAGMWVTSAIGLVIGSGMYAIGIYGAFMTLFVLEVFRQLSHHFLSKHYGVQIKLKPESVPIVLVALQERNVKFAFRSLKNSQTGDKTSELFLVLTLRPGTPISDIGADLSRIEGVKSLAVK
jgi:putative Mg2+ transporter-C (MgtC) family protein